MKKITLFLASLAAMVPFYSCTEPEFKEGEDLSIKIKISPDVITFTENGRTVDGETYLDVVPVVKMGSRIIKEGWQATTEASYATIENVVVEREFTETYTGEVYTTKENGFRLSVAPNESLNRTFTVTVTYGEESADFVYGQKGAKGAPEINISKKSLSVMADVTAPQVLSYTTNMDHISASSDSDWCTVAVDESAKTIAITSTANTTPDDRTAIVTVEGKTGEIVFNEKITLVQLGVGKSSYDGIQSAADFRDFAAKVNAGDGTAMFEDPDGVIRLKADIDMASAGIWTPIGTVGNPFSGIFDGQDHKIYNISLSSEEGLVGLFGCVSGEVKNVIIGSKDGSTYDGASSFASTRDDAAAAWVYVGSISARAAVGAKLTNIKNFASVGVAAGNNKTRIGGLVGMVIGTTLDDCANYGHVYNDATESNTASLLAGITSLVDDGSAPSSYFNRCENHGEISTTSKAVSRLGGIVGQTNPTAGTFFTECKNFGAITHSPGNAATAWTPVAGILAQPNAQKVVIDKCENHGNITVTNLKQVVRAGGIVGTCHKETNVTGCLNDGKISVIYDAGTIANWICVGGIASFSENQETVTLTGNTNKGEVYVKVCSDVSHANHVTAGGILGSLTNGTVANNVNYGKIYCENTAAVQGSAVAGGIMGLVKDSVKGSIDGNENYGEVKSVTASPAGNSGIAAGTCLSAAGGLYGVLAYTSPVSGISNGAVENASAAGALVGYNLSCAVSGQAAGSVNGTAVTADNVATLAVGLNNGSIGSVTLYSK